jgi:hypothetical protein
MKFYETHYEEYLHALQSYNLHSELIDTYERLPKNIMNLGNLIVFGPTGVGKYTQVLNIIKKYSNSLLKYDKKIKIQTDKQDYIYRISDIHYEIDMSLLGCNSKILWHEIFLQIVDIISVKPDKKGVILCKNFHCIHAELLEIFYSYIQQYNHPSSQIQIRFIILTEHISFLPNNILNCCKTISVKRPSKEQYIKMSSVNAIDFENKSPQDFVQRITQLKKNIKNSEKIKELMENIDPENIVNSKELFSFSLLKDNSELPNDIFNTICNNIIKEIENPNKIIFTNFRDTIYDILIYNLDITECLWYILVHFINVGLLKEKDISEILKKSYTFLKYYNNNYRPIYHLESIFFYIINKIYNFNEF